MNIPTQSVLRLAKPICGTNCNITADNWFSSIKLVQQLEVKKLTYVETLTKNKREIPPEFQPHRCREVNSTSYEFTKSLSLISHVPKKLKAVLLISSMHHSISTDKFTEKPEIMSHYNLMKGGVDRLDRSNAYIYGGKDTDGTGLSEEEKKMNILTRSVLRLAKPICGTNRNITADNLFSSIKLVHYIAHYNLMKGGVDRLDAKFAKYAAKPGFCRWPHVVYQSLQENNTER
ncbi:uncharacterized protein [Diabrotica undecimpunctata]|uniref:uncharacterized protein n=1 Tax=Diabrotica undecimpunctata TaxID=50387 RepID=UPI003B63F657